MPQEMQVVAFHLEVDRRYNNKVDSLNSKLSPNRNSLSNHHKLKSQQMIGLATAAATVALLVRKLLKWSERDLKQKKNEAGETE